MPQKQIMELITDGKGKTIEHKLWHVVQCTVQLHPK